MRRPLLMMRTRGLDGPVFSRHAGARASHPLATNAGNTIVLEQIDIETIPKLANCMLAEGWELRNISSVYFDVVGTGGALFPVTVELMLACDFTSYPSAIANDLHGCMNDQGKCL